MKGVKKFLMIDDSLKQQRLEWVLGTPQLVNKRQYRTGVYDLGAELVERINDDAYHYVTGLTASGSTKSEDALLSGLLKGRGRLDTFCCRALKDLLSLCLKDRQICEYVYKCAPPSYQYARYSDWFRGYLEHQQHEMESTNMSTYSYYQPRIQAIKKAFVHLEKFEAICQEMLEAELAAMASVPLEELAEIKKVWRGCDHDEVIKHWPPRHIIGKQLVEEQTVAQFEDNTVRVRLIELNCEYMLSNPTGLFNLSLPEKLLRTKNYSFFSYA